MNAMITAQFQFEQRLSKYGLLDSWYKQGKMGKVGTEDNDDIVVFVHEDKGDFYSEIHYPTFNELRENQKFIVNCLNEWYDEEFNDLFREIVDWGVIKDKDECPLMPVDVYFPADEFSKYSINFEDKTVNEALKICLSDYNSLNDFIKDKTFGQCYKHFKGNGGIKVDLGDREYNLPSFIVTFGQIEAEIMFDDGVCIFGDIACYDGCDYVGSYSIQDLEKL